MKHPMLLMRMIEQEGGEFWATHRKGGPRWGSCGACVWFFFFFFLLEGKGEGLKETRTGPQFTKVVKSFHQP